MSETIITKKQKDIIAHLFIAEGLNWSPKHIAYLQANGLMPKELKGLSVQKIYNASMEIRKELNESSLKDLGVEIF